MVIGSNPIHGSSDIFSSVFLEYVPSPCTEFMYMYIVIGYQWLPSVSAAQLSEATCRCLLQMEPIHFGLESTAVLQPVLSSTASQ